ncbi:Uncharacterised protein [uncultured archaeon]|nr:Uncharacterised protein [uncultured archaeon]
MQMRFNKKGQASQNEVVYAVVALLVLAALGLLIYKFVISPSQGASKVIPDEDKILLTACDNSLFKGNVDRYCMDYKVRSTGSVLSSKTLYSNCYDLYKEYGSATPIDCSGGSYAQRECITLAGKGELNTGDVVTISGTSCSFKAATPQANAVVTFGTTDVSSQALAAYPTLAMTK